MTTRRYLIVLLLFGPVAAKAVPPEWQRFDEVKATVIVFVGTDCPISNGYMPELGRLAERWKEKPVRILAVYSLDGMTAEAARKHAAEYKLPWPTLADASLAIAKTYRAETMPSGVVIDSAGKVVYRGRIDNRYAGYGKLRPQPSSFEIRDVVDTLLRGEAPGVKAEPAIGCPIY